MEKPAKYILCYHIFIWNMSESSLSTASLSPRIKSGNFSTVRTSAERAHGQ